MDFDGIDVNLLRNSVNECINSINYNALNEILFVTSDNNVWSSLSRDKFNKSLTSLVQKDYSNLIKKLEDMQKIVNKIEEYQNVSQTGDVNELQRIKNNINEMI